LIPQTGRYDQQRVRPLPVSLCLIAFPRLKEPGRTQARRLAFVRESP
jgi:hypothetical protein